MLKSLTKVTVTQGPFFENYSVLEQSWAEAFKLFICVCVCVYVSVSKAVISMSDCVALASSGCEATQCILCKSVARRSQVKRSPSYLPPRVTGRGDFQLIHDFPPAIQTQHNIKVLTQVTPLRFYQVFLN